MDLLANVSHGFAAALASALLHSLWQNALLAVAAALVLSAMAHAGAALRHGVGMVFLVAMVIVPALTSPWLDLEGFIVVQGSPPMAVAVVLLWLLGAGLTIVRHVGGLRVILAMERGTYQPLPAPWQRRVDELRSALGIARSVAVRLSADVVQPCTARLMRPVIWLPLSLLTRTPVEQVDALLAHELAHIARKDWLWNGIQCIVESVLFFHPAAWWLGRRIRQEREHACDDLAVAACGNPVALAEALLTLAHERRPSTHPLLAADGGTLRQRISRLLSAPPSRGPWAVQAIGGALIVACALLIAQTGLAGSRMPELNVSASTSGVLGPGDYREITAGDPDMLRFYRASVDARGVLTEIYREDGREKPIDAQTRRWINEIENMSPSPPPVFPGVDDPAPEVVTR